MTLRQREPHAAAQWSRGDAKEIAERCRQQRITMLLEREALHLREMLREQVMRARMRKHFQREADAVAKKLIQSVGDDG